LLISALKFAAGAAVGIVLWVYATPSYNRIVSSLAEPLVRVDSRLRHAELVVNQRRLIGRGGDKEPSLPAVLIPADQLTYNIVLLLGLLATNRAAFRDRGLLRLLLAVAVLFLTHVLAVVVSLELTWATRTGPWGASHYSPLAQDFWTALEYGYRLFGMFGVAFACWWVTRTSATSASLR
jgi:hypothetical protein